MPELDLEKIGVLDFLNRVVGFFNQDQQKRIHINTDLSNSSSLFVDLTKMIICIKNIVQNAFKYADTEKGVDISILLSKNMYIIEVQDYGPGINEEDKPHVFESFYRASVSKKISGFDIFFPTGYICFSCSDQ